MDKDRDKTVYIKAFSKLYRDMPFFAPMCYDEDKRQYIDGLEVNPELRPVLGIDMDSRIAIEHNEPLDLRKDKEYAKYLFIRGAVAEIANDLHSANADKHLFFIEDQEAEAQKTITNERVVADVLGKIMANTSREVLEDMAYFLSVNPAGLSDNMLLSKILRTSHEDPQKVASYYEKGAKHIVFIRKLIRHNILTRQRGSYYDGEIFVGHSEDEVKVFVLDPTNSAIVDRWGMELNQKTGKAPQGEQKQIGNKKTTKTGKDKARTYNFELEGQKVSMSREQVENELLERGVGFETDLDDEKLIDKLREAAENKK